MNRNIKSVVNLFLSYIIYDSRPGAIHIHIIKCSMPAGNIFYRFFHRKLTCTGEEFNRRNFRIITL